VALNNKFTIGFGSEYSNTSWYYNYEYFVEIPLLTAEKDVLYYQDSEDPTIFGQIQFASALNVLDITELPTVYSGNTVVDNANTGGLVQGRPWTTTPTYSFVTSGAMLYLDAGNATSYTSGTTWTDLSSNNNDATLVSSPTFTDAGTDSYFSFNGSTQYAPVTTSKMNVTLTGKTTMFVIRTVNANTANATYRNLFGGSTAARNFNTYMYHISGNTWRMHFSTGPASPWAPSVSASFTVTDNQWIVVAATQTTGGVVTYYVNGQQIGTPDTGVTFYQFTNSGIEAVARSDNYWRGDIAVAAVYSRALSSAEILQNHNSILGRYGL
jgi:hypothetical protein